MMNLFELILNLNEFDAELNKVCKMSKTDEEDLKMPRIKDVIFNDPATIVFWADGSKTIVKCQNGDIYSKETGLAMAIAKKAYGNNGRFNEVFAKWLSK